MGFERLFLRQTSRKISKASIVHALLYLFLLFAMLIEYQFDHIKFTFTFPESANIIGYGTGTVNSDINTDSQSIPIYKEVDPILPKKYPKFTKARFVAGKYPAGWMPGDWDYDATKILIIKNITFTTEVAFLIHNGYHLFSRSCHPRYWGIGQPYHWSPYNYTCFKTAVCVGHQHTHEWGHWSLEIMPSIACMPQEILKDAVFIVPEIKPFIIDNLRELDIEPWRIWGEYNGRVHAETLITIRNIWCGDLNRRLILNLRNYFKKKFSLDNIVPFRYIIANRRPDQKRYVADIHELVDACNKEFPMFHFEAFTPDDSKPFFEQALFFNSFKFIWGVHGSLMANILYMQPKTVVVEIQCENNWLNSFLNVGQIAGLCHFAGRDNINFYEKKNNTIDLSYNLYVIATAFVESNYIFKNQTRLLQQ